MARLFLGGDPREGRCLSGGTAGWIGAGRGVAAKGICLSWGSGRVGARSGGTGEASERLRRLGRAEDGPGAVGERGGDVDSLFGLTGLNFSSSRSSSNSLIRTRSCSVWMKRTERVERRGETNGGQLNSAQISFQTFLPHNNRAWGRRFLYSLCRYNGRRWRDRERVPNLEYPIL